MNNIMDLTREDFFQVSRRLEQYHAVFYKLWELGKPVFTDKIPTACVSFDKKGKCLNFLFNPDFWQKASPRLRDFVICHECLHVILNHGIRTTESDDKQKCNVALDVVVNGMLIREFDFLRSEVDPDKKFCWVDTEFPGEKLPDDEIFEYYYNRLDIKKVGGQFGQLVDDHGQLTGEESEAVIKELNEKMSNEDKKDIKDIIEKFFEEELKGLHQGTGPGGMWSFVTDEKVKKNKKWETVIKNWARKYIKDDFRRVEHWAPSNRRWALLPDDIILPTEMEIEEDSIVKDKVLVYFFIDMSGSCVGYKDRFWKAAKSLPTKRFDVKYFSFDTDVYTVDIAQNKMKGGGGTYFHILEDKIQKDIKKENIKYSDAVFILTDGAGDIVHPQYPERWVWFLTYPYDYCIPKTSQKYMLKDFE